MNNLKYILSFFVLLILVGLLGVFISKVSAAQSPKTLTQKKLLNIQQRKFKAVCDKSQQFFANCNAKVTTLDDGVTPEAGATYFSGSLGPAQLHSAYNLPCTPGGSTASACAAPPQFGPQTIAIAIAFHDPTLENDLNVYSSTFGIPSCTKASGCLTVVNQNGGSSLPSTVNSGWVLEESMDVQIAHSICQTCKILVVEANSNTFADLATAVNTAANLGANAISNSYGGSEWSGESAYDPFYNHPGIAVTASSGDNGYGTLYPASSTYVISVGGTTLQLFSDFSYAGESVWSGTGSGCSKYELVSSWQTSLGNWSQTGCNTKRANSDVAAVADPNTGAAVYDSTPYYGQTGWWQVGGTSLSSPIIAAVYALGGAFYDTQAALIPYSNYSLVNFHDITSGNNGSCSTIMCNGGIGFDGPTGLGSPNGLGGFGGSPSATQTPTPTPTSVPSNSPTPTPTPSPTPSGDSIAPTVFITSPLDGSFVRTGRTITIRADASDNVKVTRVEFYVSGSLLSTDSYSPYRAYWTVPSLKGVSYIISAKAFDTAGNSSTSSVNVTSR